jgi:sulfur-carrier protein
VAGGSRFIHRRSKGSDFIFFLFWAHKCEHYSLLDKPLWNQTVFTFSYKIVNFSIVQYGDVTKMPEVIVRFFTALREIVNRREETLTFGDSQTVTVDLVLKLLSKKYGVSFSEYVYDVKTGQPKSFLQFLVNGTSTSTLDGLETKLKHGDVLAILPPVGGG